MQPNKRVYLTIEDYNNYFYPKSTKPSKKKTGIEQKYFELGTPLSTESLKRFATTLSGKS